MINLKQILYIFSFIVFISCNTSNDLSGSYADIKTGDITQIKRVTGSKYLIISPTGDAEISAIRKGNVLLGKLSTLPVSCEFSPAFDTVWGKLNGEMLFIGKKK